MLASVSTLQEAAIVLLEQVDIIDLKDPAVGALGGLPVGQIKEIVDFVDNRCLVSATIGDLPMDAPRVFKAVQAVAETQVDFVKIGFMADDRAPQVIQALSRLTSKYRLIAVLFADQMLDLSIVKQLKKNGFSGVMVDTFDKSQGSLTKIMDTLSIARFVNLVQATQLLCGLAGSLQLTDVPGLLTFSPDYLGFRGALCDQLNRSNSVQVANVRVIKQLMSASN